MDTGSRRIRKTVLRDADKKDAVAETVSTVEIDGHKLPLMDIRATGDLLLDVTFENRKSSAKLTPGQDSTSRSGIAPLGAVVKNTKNPNSRVVYRVRLDTLRKLSNYFELLLGSDKFSEGKGIAATFASLKMRDIVPAEADAQDLPRISIIDDDETTLIAGRDIVFGDLMRILHGAEVTTRFTIPYLATLAIMADRFDCAAAVGRYVKGPKKFPWPQTYGIMTHATEELLRQKILISWLLDDQIKLAAATKELILRGSSRWIGTDEHKEPQGIWWDLQDGIEGELQYRRHCILSTIASLQGHFLALYTSRKQQCKQFYDSSAACDSYQLGEMIKFFMHKGLLSLTSPLAVFDDYPEAYKDDIEILITTLRQCPSYQIDKNHAHCGLRGRIIPALDYIQAMLTSNIGIDRHGWKTDRPSSSWETSQEAGAGEPFLFTRSIAGDSRLKMDGYLMAGRHAKALFTTSVWDWSPEDESLPRSGFGFQNFDRGMVDRGSR